MKGLPAVMGVECWLCFGNLQRGKEGKAVRVFKTFSEKNDVKKGRTLMCFCLFRFYATNLSLKQLLY
jgi:hypothetical protein